MRSAALKKKRQIREGREAMNGWMEGRLGHWIAGWTDGLVGQVDGSIDRYIYVCSMCIDL